MPKLIAFSYLFWVCLCAKVAAQASDHFASYHSGDLLFLDLDCGPLCDAIESVTLGLDSLPLSHVGIVLVEDGHISVLEATTQHGVRKIGLDAYLEQSSTEPLHMRLKAPYSEHIPLYIDRALTLVGKPYDSHFTIGDDKWYCSELVYHAFTIPTGVPIFVLEPMTFRARRSDSTFFPSWETYFRHMDIPVPEGALGINPGGISRSTRLEIVSRPASQ